MSAARERQRGGGKGAGAVSDCYSPCILTGPVAVCGKVGGLVRGLERTAAAQPSIFPLLVPAAMAQTVFGRLCPVERPQGSDTASLSHTRELGKAVARRDAGGLVLYDLWGTDMSGWVGGWVGLNRFLPDG